MRRVPQHGELTARLRCHMLTFYSHMISTVRVLDKRN